MQSQRDEIDKPLGQDLRPARSGKPRLPRAGNLIVGLVALAILAVSAGIALREHPFRDPPRAAVTSPEQTRAETSPTDGDAVSDAGIGANPATVEGNAAPKGPAIIRMGEDDVGGGNTIVVRDPSALGQNQYLAYLPNRALIEESEMGPLPVRGADGTRPFDVYARPWSRTRGAKIAVVIGGLGLSQTGTMEAIERLPAEVTLAFAPQGNSLARWMQKARRTGHEILVQVPLEPYDYPHVNPGRNTLTVEASKSERLRNLRWALSRVTNYTGIMNYMGARFIANLPAMEEVMHELSRRGLMFLDDGSAPRSVAKELALEQGVPFAAGDVLLDQSRERGAILEKLDELERIARATGSAIGTGSAFRATVDTVSTWAADVKKRGIEIVPVSALAHDPERD